MGQIQTYRLKTKFLMRSSLPKSFCGLFVRLALVVTCIMCRAHNYNAFEKNAASFIETRHYYLRVQQILHTDYVYDAIQCGLHCLTTLGCLSFNLRLKANVEGTHLCEILASDKFNHSLRFEPSEEFHHYSILSPCEYGPCQHGSTCLPLYESHGFVCHCVSGYHGVFCDKKVPVWRKVNTKVVCFGARGNSFGSFALPFSGNIMTFKLVHLSGKISCSTAASRYSYWACDKGDLLQTFLTDDSNTVVFPQLPDITSYRLPGMHSESPELTFDNLTLPLRVEPGQEFRVWYKEDLQDVSEHDNGGKTCMDVYALYV